jgi:hypothetical protein
MTYWVKRIALKNGEIVTERELRQDENLFEGPVPVVGDKLTVSAVVENLKRGSFGAIGRDGDLMRPEQLCHSGWRRSNRGSSWDG